jgi:SAM-dependent methyltransferase
MRVTPEDLASILRCPSCRRAGVTVSTDRTRCEACGTEQPREGNNLFYDPGADVSPEWREMQAGSVERYQDASYEEDQTIARLFGNFIAVGIDRTEAVLDLGCGPFKPLPPYVDQLGLAQYIGLEPLTVGVDRDYPCMVGAVAESIPLADHSVGAALFATSLDHIEAVDDAIAEVRRVVRPDGKLFFWIGLYEAETLASSKTFESIFVTGSPIKRAIRMAAAPVEYAHLFLRMRKRRRQLATGQRIDNAHCRYYTRQLVAESMAKWGLRVTRQIVPPGTCSIFVEAVAA